MTNCYYYSGPEKITYSGGVGVDLLAFNRKEEILEPGSNASIDRSVSKMTLQTYLGTYMYYIILHVHII